MVLVVPGKVIRLEFISQLFAALLLLPSTLFALLPVGPCRNVQNCLAGQNLPADKRCVNGDYFTCSTSSRVLAPRREQKNGQLFYKVTKTFRQTSAGLLTVQTAKGNVSGCGNTVSLPSPTPQRSTVSLEGQSEHTHTHTHTQTSENVTEYSKNSVLTVVPTCLRSVC